MPEALDLFHYCAWFAFMSASASGKHTDPEYVRRLACEIYEEELKKENARKPRK